MAFIQLDEKSRRYRIRFRFDGQEYKRSIRTANEKEARAILGRVEETIMLIDRGRLEMPTDVDPAAFILSDGKRNGKSRNGQIRSVSDLFSCYEKSLQDGVKEPTTLKTERIHLGHLRRLLKSSQPLANVVVADVQQYVDKRLREKSGQKSIRPDTAKKEVATFRAVWNWALSQELITLQAPTKGLRYPKRSEKPPFMTWAEIERRLSRGGLTEEEEKELWGALFLTTNETSESLIYAAEHAHHPFVYPRRALAHFVGTECCTGRLPALSLDDEPRRQRVVAKLTGTDGPFAPTPGDSSKSGATADKSDRRVIDDTDDERNVVSLAGVKRKQPVTRPVIGCSQERVTRFERATSSLGSCYSTN